MKAVNKLTANCFYVLQGISSANTHFIENKHESDQFVHYVDRYLGKYLSVYEFSITSKGWILLVRTKSEVTIKKHHSKKIEKRRNSRNVKKKKVCEILSESIRLMRSHFTRWTNSVRGREGNASKRRFQRHFFSSVSEARSYIQRVRNQDIEMDQPNPRYRANKAHYDEDGQIAKKKEEMSSKIYQVGKESGTIKRMRSLKVLDYIGKKLEDWIKSTCRAYGVENMDVRVGQGE